MAHMGFILGNSGVRYGVFDGHQVGARGGIVGSSSGSTVGASGSIVGSPGSIVGNSGRIPWSDIEGCGAELRRIADASGANLALAGSVRDDLLGVLLKHVPRRLLPVLVARRDFELPIENLYERPEEAGTDRLLNCIAARERAGGRSSVVVDFGTAVSISVVSADGAFLGGLIAGGWGSIARGIQLSAPRLPLVAPSPADGFVARHTAAALQAGIYWEVAAGVRTMLAGILKTLPGPSKVFATGGEAELFCPGIPEVDELVPDLTLEGLFHAFRLGAGGSDGLGPPKGRPPAWRR